MDPGQARKKIFLFGKKYLSLLKKKKGKYMNNTTKRIKPGYLDRKDRDSLKVAPLIEYRMRLQLRKLVRTYQKFLVNQGS